MELSEDQRDAELRQILGNIDRSERMLREIAEREHPLVRDGQVVTDPVTGKFVTDPAPALAAAEELAALARQRAQLLGLAPVNVYRVTVPPGQHLDPEQLSVAIAMRDAADRDAEWDEYAGLDE